jgi:hypothetical protein
MANLSDPCSSKLSREAYVATTCEADLTRFRVNAVSSGERIAPCLQTYLREVINSCKNALAHVETLPSTYP